MKLAIRLSAGLMALGFATGFAHAKQAIQHVLFISVDGLHASDLSRYVAGHPQSALAKLSGHGLTYSKAMTSFPSDSFPGLLSFVTGGSPRTTGIWYDAAFGNDWLKPKTASPA